MAWHGRQHDPGSQCIWIRSRANRIGGLHLRTNSYSKNTIGFSQSDGILAYKVQARSWLKAEACAADLLTRTGLPARGDNGYWEGHLAGCWSLGSEGAHRLLRTTIHIFIVKSLVRCFVTASCCPVPVS